MKDVELDEWFANLETELLKLSPAERLKKLRELQAELGAAKRKEFERRLWFNSVHRAVHAHTERHRDEVVTRQALIREDLDRISEEACTKGKTPEQSLSYYLQRLRDRGIIEFTSPGTYRLLDHECDLRKEK